MSIYNCLNGAGPEYIADLLNFSKVCSSLRGKSSNLEQAHFNYAWMPKSFSFIASKLWNKLPIAVKNCDNIKDFRKGFHKCNLESFLLDFLGHVILL